MALSRDSTAGSLWREAIREISGDVGGIPHFEKFNLVNRAIQNVAAEFFSLLANAFMTNSTITATGDTASIATLRIMRYGNETKMSLESSSLTGKVCRPVTLEALAGFRSAAAQLKKAIWWAYEGDNIQLKKGDSVTSYGTLTLRYPKLPDKLTTDAGGIDLPDGPAIEIAILNLRGLIEKRLGRVGEANPAEQAERERLISLLYSSFGQKVTTEEIEEKTRALA